MFISVMMQMLWLLTTILSSEAFLASLSTVTTTTAVGSLQATGSDGISDGDDNVTQSTRSSSEESDSQLDPVMQLPLLESKLAAATTQQERESLQQSIDHGKMVGEFGVRKAQVDFYNAFSNQDLDAMKKVWASSQTKCQCIHPGMKCIEGREAILQSWEVLFRDGAGFQIEPADGATIDICGLTAICKCVEQINGNPNQGLEAVNIYKRENGSWKMTLHMAAPFLAASSLQ